MKGSQSGYILQPANVQGAYANIANQITEAGRYDAMAEQLRLQQAAARKAEQDKLKTAGIMLVASALTGGAAALAAPAAAGAAGAGAAGAAGAGAGAAGAGASSGFLAGLGTFGKGAMGALTGSGSIPAGTGGFAGGLGATSGFLSKMGTGMLSSSSDPLMASLGSYFAQTQQANKTSSAFENTFKDPTVRQAMYGDMGEDQASAVMQYAKTLGSQDRANFYQMAAPQLMKFAQSQREFEQQKQLQDLRLRNAFDIAELTTGAKLSGQRSTGYLPPINPKDIGLENDDDVMDVPNFRAGVPSVR